MAGEVSHVAGGGGGEVAGVGRPDWEVGVWSKTHLCLLEITGGGVLA